MDTLLSRAEIPIIDLGLVGPGALTATVEAEADCSSLVRVAAQLHRSLSETGLALLVNHGVSEEKLRAGYEAMDRFCALPQEARDAYRRIPPSQHGYVAPGTERLSEEWIGEIRHTFNVSGGKLPESEVPGFEEAVSSLGEDFVRLSHLLLQAIALGLELPADFFLAAHSGMPVPGSPSKESSSGATLGADLGQGPATSHTRSAANESSLRLEFYPPFVAPPPAGVTRCGEHTDCGTLSILAQDSEGGMEVQTAEKQWARVGHLPGALLINTGDVMGAWTCNRYAPTLHRVIVPEQPKVRARGRHVVSFLVHPDNDTLITPIESLAEGCATVPAQIRAELLVDSSRRRKRSFYAPHHSIANRLREAAAS